MLSSGSPASQLLAWLNPTRIARRRAGATASPRALKRRIDILRKGQNANTPRRPARAVFCR